MSSPEITTLCYLEWNHQYLMLHRTVKKNDVNHDKWIGVGGHVEEGESPEDCLLREVREETGLILTSYWLRGVVTFLSGKGDFEYMFLYTADRWESPDNSDPQNAAAFPSSDSTIYTAHEQKTSSAVLSGIHTETSEFSPASLNGITFHEGVLEWVDIDRIESLNIWEGDKIFFRLIDQNAPFFSLKLVYDGHDHLVQAVLDGTNLPINTIS